MKEERECRDPARRSILARTSLDSVMDIFFFILPLYYQEEKQGQMRGYFPVRLYPRKL